MHSKVYEPSCLAGATLLVDFHQDSYPEKLEPYRSELAATTAASLANVLVGLNQQVGLVTNGRDAAERIRRQAWEVNFESTTELQAATSMQATNDALQPLVVPTRKSPEQLHRIRRMLARSELSDGLPLPQFLLATEHHFPRDATVIAVVGVLSTESAAALAALHRGGYAVMVVCIMASDAEFHYQAGPLAAAGVGRPPRAERRRIGRTMPRNGDDPRRLSRLYTFRSEPRRPLLCRLVQTSLTVQGMRRML